MNRKIRILLITTGVLVIPVLLSPLPRFDKPLSTVVLAADSSLLGARIADDGQWRFPAGEIPEKFEKALLAFEDRWFPYHPGVNPVSLVRAMADNLSKGEIVSGGSTITMQVARISAGNRKRTYLNKMREILSALKLELFRSKKHILSLYIANAPFGGNTVGLEAAAWRYTGKSASSISWAEAASLAILPNSPGLVFPGRNQEMLKIKRDNLLRKLCARGYIDTLTLSLALEEPVPGKPGMLPAKAPHLTDWFFKTRKGSSVVTTIDPLLQERAADIISSHQKDLSSNFIFNSSCIIIEVETGNVLAYIGNSASQDEHAVDVDIIRSLRSTGSILKPFLYAAMQQSGDILPGSLIPDIPTRFPGFSPKNFDFSYSGAVDAGSALSQSLNIPAVKMLQQYNQERFIDVLRKIGFSSFNKSAEHYGLSIILGGGETSLWELSGAYASMSRILNRYLKEKKYCSGDIHQPILEANKSDIRCNEVTDPVFSASAIWLTYEALLRVNRPESETGWQHFSSTPVIAWKTGTSFGFRDAWAAGTTPEYVIAVWAGNADGEGRPGLTGITAAAPILFDLVNLTGTGDWFNTPYEDLIEIPVCKQSGFRAGPDCTETVEMSVHLNGLRSAACPYHQVIHLNAPGTRQVNSSCISPAEIRNESWFILPPAMEYFYRQKHPEYRPLPPVDPRCSPDKPVPVMEFIYPSPGVKIFIPRDQSGVKTRIVAEIAHRNPSKRIYWHLNDAYVVTTRSIHQAELQAGPGTHVLTAVDEDGSMINVGFDVMK